MLYFIYAKSSMSKRFSLYDPLRGIFVNKKTAPLFCKERATEIIVWMQSKTLGFEFCFRPVQ